MLLALSEDVPTAVAVELWEAVETEAASVVPVALVEAMVWLFL